jgi:hypothetical protein
MPLSPVAFRATRSSIQIQFIAGEIDDIDEA